MGSGLFFLFVLKIFVIASDSEAPDSYRVSQINYYYSSLFEIASGEEPSQ
jgi:hypothetical protein